MSNARLVAHCGTNIVDENIIRAAVAPSPTETWMPITHADLLDRVNGVMGENGLAVSRRQYSMSNDQSRMFGVFDIANQDNADGSVSFAIGLRNSTDKTLPAGICFGARVFVCDNLAFSGEVVIARRHTKNILNDLDGLIKNGLSQFGTFRDNHYRAFDDLKKAEINDNDAWALCGRAYEGGALPKSRIADVMEEYRNDDHKQKHGYGTAWSLYNAGTATFKTRQARNMLDAAGESINWHTLFARKFATQPQIPAFIEAEVIASATV